MYQGQGVVRPPAFTMGDIENIIKGLQKVSDFEEPRITPKNILSTGSTLLNLGCTGKPNGGFVMGGCYLFVGDSSSGKTWLALSCFAEACQLSRYAGYKLVYDNVEDGAMMSMEKFFGKAVADRLEPPCRDKSGSPVYSETVEDFYFNAHDVLSKGPCIYILDSMDALSSGSEQKKFEEKKTAARKGKLDKVKGDYGDGKAKSNSTNLRQLLGPIKKHGSILIIICQTRDNIDAFSFEKKTRAGGRALKFYSTFELWTSVVSKIKKTVKGTQRQVGIMVRVAIKKNRLSGKEWSVDVPIYYSFGIDDVGACVDYLVAEKHWPATDTKITATEFEIEGTKDAVIRYIEENAEEKKLRNIVASVWADIEKACSLKRKPRYGQTPLP